MAGGTFVYVSNAQSKDIHVLELDASSGNLAPVQQLALDVPGLVMPLAVSPDRRFLYAAQRGEPYSVASLAIDGFSGRLTLLGFTPIPDSTPYICTDRSGRWLLLASYGGHLVSVSPIGPQGFVQSVHQVVRTEMRAHAIQVDAANRHVLVPSLGDDVFLQWRFDSVSGRLTANQPPFVRVGPGAGPRHFAFHPNNRWVYLLTELDGSLHLYDYDALNGTLNERGRVSLLPDGFNGPPFGEEGASTNGGPKAADLHITPDGRFLYASERTTSTLAAFRVGEDSGRLEKLGSYPTEETPRGFNIDPSGRYLLAAGQTSNHLSIYAIDRDSGALTPTGRYALGAGPNWVEIHRLP